MPLTGWSRAPAHGVPYWRRAGTDLVYVASLGALVPYWGLYLASLGYGPGAIGELTAILTATKVVAPNVWGWIAERRGAPMAVVRLASALAALSFAGVYLGSGYRWLALVLTVFSFFWNAVLPQLEATTFSHLREGVYRYTHIRVWGSVGFVLSVAGLGGVLDRHGAGILPAVVLALMGGIWVSTLLVPERTLGHLALGHEPIGRVLRRRPVIALLTACFLAQASHGPYYAFYSIYLEGHGYSHAGIGELWALGVTVEVLLFVFMHRLLARFRLRPLFLAALGLTALRWLLIGLWPERVGVLVAAQVLHAASFGVFHAVAVQFVHRFFAGRHHGRGQALYSSMSFGAGGALGTLLAGYAWDAFGPEAVFLGAAVTAAASFGVVARWLDEPAPIPVPAAR